MAGQVGQTQAHAHYAHQVLIACAAPVQASIQGQVECGPLLLIASGQPHAILSEQPAITLFAEPLAFELPVLRQLCEDAGADLEGLNQRLRALPRRPLHPRLATALQRVRALDENTLPAAQLASEAALSLSQLERLFSGQLGLSVRRLVFARESQHVAYRTGHLELLSSPAVAAQLLAWLRPAPDPGP